MSLFGVRRLPSHKAKHLKCFKLNEKRVERKIHPQAGKKKKKLFWPRHKVDIVKIIIQKVRKKNKTSRFILVKLQSTREGTKQSERLKKVSERKDRFSSEEHKGQLII